MVLSLFPLEVLFYPALSACLSVKHQSDLRANLYLDVLYIRQESPH